MRALIRVGRDRETAKIMRQFSSMVNNAYKDDESTTDRFWKLYEWMEKKGKYLVNKYDCPASVIDSLVFRLYREGYLQDDDEEMTDEVRDMIARYEAVFSNLKDK